MTICHYTSSPTNPFVIITISENALAAHLAHGDVVFPRSGECPVKDDKKDDKKKDHRKDKKDDNKKDDGNKDKNDKDKKKFF